MKTFIPRLRLFAGPNGSGKSSIKDKINHVYLGHYINPDLIEASIKSKKELNFSNYGIDLDINDYYDFLKNSSLYRKNFKVKDFKQMCFHNNIICFANININSYLSSVLTDYLRNCLLKERRSFSFESVMSHYSKIDFLSSALNVGYRTYLYYIATEDPEINISRIKNRVLSGGHDVQTDKVITRYYRSLELLKPAIKKTNRTYLFDNSGKKSEFIAEITNGSEVIVHSDKIPVWVDKYVFS